MTLRRKGLLSPGAVPRPRWRVSLRALLLALPLCLPLAALAANEMTGALEAFRAGDYDRALRLSRPLAAKENSQAMYLLGVMYEQGKGVERDDPTAVKWYAAAARKASNASAQYNLARMYLDGRGVRKNEAKAREWLEVAAAQGHAESVKLLAELGGSAAAPNVVSSAPAPAAPVANAAPAAPRPEPPPARTPEPAKAAAAPAAPTAATGTTPVLAAYQNGDYAQALKLSQPLAGREDGPGMYVLGKLYEEGHGIKRDDYTAVKWLAAASHKANYAPAEYALARMYMDGRGVGKNQAKAKEWLGAAAAQGHAESQRLLAELGGKSVPVAAAAPPVPPPAPVAVAAPHAPPAPVAPAAPAAPAPAAVAITPAAPVAPAQPKPAEVAKAPQPPARPAPAPRAPEPEAPKTAMITRPAPPVEAPASRPPLQPTSPPPAATPAPPAPATAVSRTGPPFGAYSPAAAKVAVASLEAAFKRSAGSNPATPAAARAQLEEPLLTVAMRYWEAEADGQRQGMEELRAAVQAPAAIGVGRAMRASTSGSELAAAALLTELTQGGSGAATQACDAYVAAANARGPDHAPALYHAALCNAQKNPKQSLDWLQASALAGHAGALETLGRACVEGSEKDWGCASHYFELAARRGRPSSMTLYGWVLSNQPVASEKDFISAIEWYRKGAAAGDLFAQNNIGEMYERGRGTGRDDKLARQWYGRAAEAGFGPGQFNYARMLLAGTGGPTDRDGAVQWLKKAESNGVAPAKAALQQIAAAGNIK
ncbi:MAG: putative repeat protein [Betaproteobacteria bacterium]|nr:putative repeat protein [Betaproteobacteria bacterium]